MREILLTSLLVLNVFQNTSAQLVAYQVWQKTYDATIIKEGSNGYVDDHPGLTLLSKVDSIMLYIDVTSIKNYEGTGERKGICINENGNFVQVNNFGIYHTSADGKIKSANLYSSSHNAGTGKIEVAKENPISWGTLIDHPIPNPGDKIVDWPLDIILPAQTQESGLIVLGQFNGTTAGRQYFTGYVNVQNGNVVWSKTRNGNPENIFTGPGTSSTPKVYVTGSNRTVVYSGNGNLLAELPDPVSGKDVLVDSYGNIYVAGMVSTNIYFMQNDVKLVKYKDDYTKDWEIIYDMNADDDEPYLMKFDKEKNIITAALGCETRRQTVDGECQRFRTVLLKTTPQGALLWSSKQKPNPINEITDIVFDVDANIYYIEDKSVLVKVDGFSGDILYEKKIEMKGSQGEILYPEASKLEVDTEGNIYIIGTITSLYNPPPNQTISNIDVVILKYTQKEDYDKDGIPNIYDNCPSLYNPGQEDVDKDGVGDSCDNCPAVINEKQADQDNDQIGDVCDNCISMANNNQKDVDFDGFGDVCDNCINIYNQNQADEDDDKIGDVCDNCRSVWNRDQTDTDHDGIGDKCDNDIDDDGIPNNIDNCDYIKNADQLDADKDGIGDACNNDIDKDGDEWCDSYDNCPKFPNPDQADADHNQIGDACESHLSIDHIEVTQGIQDGSVQLVTGKPTYVRVFYNVGMAARPIGPISGYIRFYYENGLPMLTYNCGLGNSNLNSLNQIIVQPQNNPVDPNSTLNFVIPPSCLWDNTPYIKVFTFYHGDPADLPEQYTVPVHQPVPLNFTSVDEFNLTFVPIDLDVCHTPSESDFFRALEFVNKVFPTSKYGLKKSSVWYHYGDPTDMDLGVAVNGAKLISELALINFFTNDEGSNRKYYGLVCSEINPCKNLNDPLSCDVTGMGIDDEAWGVFDDYSVKESTMPHELTHTLLGVSHVKDNCESRFPYYNSYPGSINGNLEEGTYGFDGSKVYPYYDYFDMMTYCSPQWISAYIYKKLQDAFSYQKKSATAQIKYLSEFKETGENDLVINGYVNLIKKTVDATIKLIPANTASSEDPNSNFRIELLDVSQHLIDDYSIPLKTIDNETQLKCFIASIPFNKESKYIRYILSGETVQMIPISSHLPVVSLQSPNGGENISDSFNIRWVASDMDNDTLTYDVLYSVDNGNSWMPLVLNYRESNFSWDSKQSPGSDHAIIRIICNDGVNSSTDQSDAVFTVAQKNPDVYITKPLNKDTFFYKSWIKLSAECYDYEDEDKLRDTIHFYSETDGLLGIGSVLYIDSLSPGNHRIIARVSDNDGNIGADTVLITILEIMDSDHDSIPDNLDNCPMTYNPGQLDYDKDKIGDACEDDDTDHDGFIDRIDNCMFVKNDQTDSDNDGIGDACDECMYLPLAGDTIQGSDIPEEGSLQIYSVPYDSTATYLWYFPVGWETEVHSNTATVKVGNTSGTITLVMGNKCGKGTRMKKLVSVKLVSDVEKMITENTLYALYPNPTRDYLIIDLKKELGTDAKISILDIYGRVLINRHISATETKVWIDIHELMPGMYCFSLCDGEKQAISKFVKTK